MNEFQIRVRSYIFRIVVLLAFVILAAQLWNLQVVQGEYYTELADANRFRVSQVDASRGVMYDRHGALLVRNRASYEVVIIPAYLPDDETAESQLFARLSELLNLPVTTQVEPTGGYNNGHFHAITHHQYNRQLNRQIINPRSRRYINAPEGIRDAVNERRFIAPFLPVTIATDVDPIIIAKLEEELLAMPGVLIEIEPIRDYLHGDLLGPLLGYTGPIPAELFDDYDADGYDLVDRIGLAGLELIYEADLRGIKGLENIEVDANGQKVRTINQIVQARPGKNLQLTLDLELQQVAQEALQAAMDEVESNQGAVVALDPNTGAVLAMVTLPSFDNNSFSRGISLRELALLSEDPWTPLVNHAIAGYYPPGSTYKIVTVAGALQEDVVQPATIFYDEGTLYLPNQFAPENKNLAQPFPCWLRSGHEEVNAVLGLAYSCNVYMYYIGGGYYPEELEGLGLERLGQYAQLFGFGAETGIDLPGEGAGLVPDARWKRINHAEQWLTGDTYNMAIGQGFVLATPLQVANAYAAIANGGMLYQPYLVESVLNDQGEMVRTKVPTPIHDLNLDFEVLNVVQQGLRGVIAEEAGTAYDEFDVPGVIASGKTGTAEFCDEYPQCIGRDGRVQTSHAWFTAYAPSTNPEIVVVVFVYGGDEGSVTAVPVANQVLRHYFGIDQEQDEDDEDELTATGPLTPTYQARFLSADGWLAEGASISGFVFDTAGNGVPEVSIDIMAEGALVAQIYSGPTGQFDYTELNENIAEDWEFRLTNYPTRPALRLKIANGLRYLVEFEQIEEPLSNSQAFITN